MLEDVRRGLSQPQKQLPRNTSTTPADPNSSKPLRSSGVLSDPHGDRPSQNAGLWLGHRDGARILVELGAGSARKTRILLAAMAQGTPERTYAPVDVAGEFLRATAESLRVEDPSLDVRPQVRDITWSLDFVGDLPGPVLFALLGSTIGKLRGGGGR